MIHVVMMILEPFNVTNTISPGQQTRYLLEGEHDFIYIYTVLSNDVLNYTPTGG